MKKILYTLVLFLVNNILFAQNVNIPDTNFKTFLLSISGLDANNDQEIQVSEAQTLTGTIDCKGKNIADLTGVEAFTNIKSLICHTNQLTSLDVSANTALVGLNCSSNQITNLDVSRNTALNSLFCEANKLTSLDVSANTALMLLSCSSNQLTSLNVANNSNSLTRMNALNNPNLTCIQTNANVVGTTPLNWQKDAGASYSANCSASTCTNIVNIPDANFKNALLAHGTTIVGTNISVIDTDGDGEICQSEAQAYTGIIKVFNESIADLTGIEAFTSLTDLDCRNNQLTSLDISANTALTQLYCSRNQLTSLDVSVNTALTELDCGINPLTSLDVSANTALTELYCRDNQLTSLDVSANTALTSLRCGTNPLTSLDVSANTALTVLDCRISQLTSLDVSVNTALRELDCSSSKLTSLDISANTALRELYCESNQLTSLDVSANTALTFLDCRDNQLTSIDISANTALTKLFCIQNQLISLNVANGNNTNMTGMRANNNPSLTCIQTDAGIVGTNPTGWRKDAGASYSANCASASINDETFSNALQVYPNPVSNILTVTANQTEISKLTLYKLLGKKVLETTQNTANLSKLAKGLYILKVQSNDNKIATKKIIKE